MEEKMKNVCTKDIIFTKLYKNLKEEFGYTPIIKGYKSIEDPAIYKVILGFKEISWECMVTPKEARQLLRPLGYVDPEITKEIDAIQEYIDILWKSGQDELALKWIKKKEKLVTLI